MSLIRTQAALVVAICAAVMSLTSAAPLSPGFMRYNDLQGRPFNVSYDKRALLIDGVPALFLSGSVHPPRSTPGTWDAVLAQAAADGLNMVEVYIFWNYHEPVEGQLVWDGRGDLTHFLDLCKKHNLFVNLRIGPYVCAEWTYGGIPVWLGLKDGVKFRTVNSVWQTHMQQWMQTVVNKVHDYFAPQGGPIVMAQVENELHAGSSTVARQYINWCGTMAASLGAGVPWIMCNGDSAPNTINTCNGGSCTGFISEHGQNGRILVDQPALWTENEGGFQIWGNSPHNTTNYFWGRSPADIAYAIAQWFARGGSHMNYYMWFGGNHYGRWAGASITTMYASDVNLCPDTLRHEPKYSHLNKLHELLAKYAAPIVSSPAQLSTPEHLLWFSNATRAWRKGVQQLAFVYNGSTSGLAFIENQCDCYIKTQWRGVNFTLPNQSVSLVDIGSMQELFNTATVAPASQRRTLTTVAPDVPFKWRVWHEPLTPAATARFPSVTADRPYEQSNVTLGLTEYLWYQRNVTVATAGDAELAFQGRSASGYVVFVNGVKAGEVNDHHHSVMGDLTYKLSVPLSAGDNQLLILSTSFGYTNNMDSGSGPKTKGIVGSVTLGAQDITAGTWNMRPQLAGQALQVYTAAGAKRVQWSGDWQSGGPGTWYTATFTTPSLSGGKQLLLRANGMTRGQLYVNGHELGRYWMILENDGSGHATQGVYHIPADWLIAGDGANVLTLAEVIGASDASQVRLVTSQMVDTTMSSSDADPQEDIQTCVMW